MRTSCPSCGRETMIDEHAGDFPVRCGTCRALIRRRQRAVPPPRVESRRLAAMADDIPPPCTRIERGMLAGLLISRSTSEEAGPALVHAGDAALEPSDHAVLRPELRRALARARGRQRALVRAVLKSRLESLGALSWAGLALSLILGIGALALKVQAVWRQPVSAGTDELRLGEVATPVPPPPTQITNAGPNSL